MKRGMTIGLKNSLLVLSSLITIVAFLRVADTGADPRIIIVLLWGTGPYILFWLVTFLLERFSSMRQVPGIGLGLSILILIYALAVYLLPLNHKSSTEGLIFMFAPFWLYLFTLPALGICILIAWLSNRQVGVALDDR